MPQLREKMMWYMQRPIASADLATPSLPNRCLTNERLLSVGCTRPRQHTSPMKPVPKRLGHFLIVRFRPRPPRNAPPRLWICILFHKYFHSLDYHLVFPS
eukprot:COSAG01_NODE_461_length_16698_cov_113.458160_1_plen_100_part_00